MQVAWTCARILRATGIATCSCSRLFTLWFKLWLSYLSSLKVTSGVSPPEWWCNVTRRALTCATPRFLLWTKSWLEVRYEIPVPLRGSCWAAERSVGLRRQTLASGCREGQQAARRGPRGAAHRDRLPAAPRRGGAPHRYATGREELGSKLGNTRSFRRPYLTTSARARPPLRRHSSGDSGPHLQRSLLPRHPALGAAAHRDDVTPRNSGKLSVHVLPPRRRLPRSGRDRSSCESEASASVPWHGP